jgi:hypothetical protein
LILQLAVELTPPFHSQIAQQLFEDAALVSENHKQPIPHSPQQTYFHYLLYQLIDVRYIRLSHWAQAGWVYLSASDHVSLI